MAENNKTSQDVEVETDYKIVKPEEKVPGIHTYRSVMRLLVGATIEGGDELMQRLRAWEEEHLQDDYKNEKAADESAMQRARFALIGLLYEAPETAVSGALTLYETSERVGKSVGSLLGPVAKSRAMSPIRKRFGRLQSRAELAVERWTEVGRVQEPYGRALVRYLLPEIIDDFLAALTDNEEIAALIEVQAGRYVDYLAEHPEQLDQLVQRAGDNYIHYLHDENPDDVQDLIAGQTIGITTEIADEVRERTVTADSLMEMVFRSLMRRTPRQDLPEPPAEVQKLAIVTRTEQRKRAFALLDGTESDDDDAD